MAKPAVGFIGLGLMGRPMVANLLKAGFAVTVWNRTASKTVPLVELGATRADTVNDLGRCDIVFTSVTSSRDLLAVTLGPEGLFNAFNAQSAPRIVVDTSAVSAEAAAEVRAEAAGRGIEFLSAPISGNG